MHLHLESKRAFSEVFALAFYCLMCTQTCHLSIKNTHKFKMMGTRLEAELFLNASADFRGMKRRELIALGDVQNVTCRTVKCLGRFQATDLISSLIPY